MLQKRPFSRSSGTIFLIIFLSEETGEVVMDSRYKWIIDPIDGTVNFAHGLPICCVSIEISRMGR